MNEQPERKPLYLIDYRHKGETWSFTIYADRWADAEARIRSIGGNGKVIGSNVYTAPVNSLTLPFAAALAAIVCWFRNLGRRA